jgi:hypothetical protein
LSRFEVERLNDGNVATVNGHELVAELPGASEPNPLSLDDKRKRMVEKVRKIAKKKTSATHENNWKSSANRNDIQRQTRTSYTKYRQA